MTLRGIGLFFTQNLLLHAKEDRQSMKVKLNLATTPGANGMAEILHKKFIEWSVHSAWLIFFPVNFCHF